MSNFEPVLSEATIERIKLHDSSWILPEHDGIMPISTKLLRSCHSLASSQPMASSSSTSLSVSLDPSITYISIPTVLDSTSAFEFCGFTSLRATSIHASLCRSLQNYGSRLFTLDLIREIIDLACHGIEDSTDDWNSAMTEAGINSSIRNVLMEEEHMSIRGTRSLSQWLFEILSMNYNFLDQLEGNIEANLASNIEENGSEDGKIPVLPEGHLRLYKSIEYRSDPSFIAEDGTIDLVKFISHAPTDFSRICGLCFTPNLWVAKRYSALMSDACPFSDRRTLEIHAPLEHFTKLRTWRLKFEDDEFKQLVYHCRGEKKYPCELAKKRFRHGIIYGPVACAHDFSFRKMKDWSIEVTDSHVLTRDDGTGKDVATQYAWITEEGITQLEEDVLGKVYVHESDLETR